MYVDAAVKNRRSFLRQGREGQTDQHDDGWGMENIRREIEGLTIYWEVRGEEQARGGRR
jgi:hypothetical protein